MSTERHVHSKKIINRLSRIEGHVGAIKNMVREERACTDIFIQIAAVRKALDNTAKEILKEHLTVCVDRLVQEGKQKKALEEVQEAIDKYLK